MKVIINQIEYEYSPDYPAGWSFSAGDPYKFNVRVGDHDCFVKRFQATSAERITGWGLLTTIEGKSPAHLSKVYAICRVTEAGEELVYVFYEQLKGSGLDKLIRKREQPELKRMTEGLTRAISELEMNGYWFSDFCEKNIFCLDNGDPTLIDLDSAHRITLLPENDMWGSKDYWILVLKYFKEVLKQDDIRLTDIHGISFNYLQIPFLILRIRLFFDQRLSDYNSSAFFNQLPQRLHDLAPGLDNFFLSAINTGKQALTREQGEDIANLVKSRILDLAAGVKLDSAPQSVPVIRNFSANKQEVKSGESFRLSWDLSNADKLELYRNDGLFLQVEPDLGHLDLKQVADGTRDLFSYHLLAYKGLGVARSPVIQIRLKMQEAEKVRKKSVLPWLLGGLLIAVLGYGGYLFLRKPPVRYQITQRYLRSGVDSLVEITGNRISAEESPMVEVNGVVSTVESYQSGSLTVKLPKTPGIIKADSTATIVIRYGDDDPVEAGSLHVYPAIRNPKKEMIEGADFQLAGKFPEPDQLVAYLNGQKLVLAASDTGIRFPVPEMNMLEPNAPLEFELQEGSRLIYFSSLTVKCDTVRLIDQGRKAMWRSGLANNANRDQNDERLLSWPGKDSDIDGFALSTEAYTEEHVLNRVLWTHPRWSPYGSVTGELILNKQGNRQFQSKVGFVNNALSTDGVNFIVRLRYQSGNSTIEQKLIDQHKDYSSSLLTLKQDLPRELPSRFSLKLQVTAGPQSNNDWATWIEPMVITRRLAFPGGRPTRDDIRRPDRFERLEQ